MSEYHFDANRVKVNWHMVCASALFYQDEENAYRRLSGFFLTDDGQYFLFFAENRSGEDEFTEKLSALSFRPQPWWGSTYILDIVYGLLSNSARMTQVADNSPYGKYFLRNSQYRDTCIATRFYQLSDQEHTADDAGATAKNGTSPWGPYPMPRTDMPLSKQAARYLFDVRPPGVRSTPEEAEVDSQWETYRGFVYLGCDQLRYYIQEGDIVVGYEVAFSDLRYDNAFRTRRGSDLRNIEDQTSNENTTLGAEIEVPALSDRTRSSDTEPENYQVSASTQHPSTRRLTLERSTDHPPLARFQADRATKDDYEVLAEHGDGFASCILRLT